MAGGFVNFRSEIADPTFVHAYIWAIGIRVFWHVFVLTSVPFDIRAFDIRAFDIEAVDIRASGIQALDIQTLLRQLFDLFFNSWIQVN